MQKELNYFTFYSFLCILFYVTFYSLPRAQFTHTKPILQLSLPQLPFPQSLQVSVAVLPQIAQTPTIFIIYS
jgi:hypothetical protein